jgi:hypothetical protein
MISALCVDDHGYIWINEIVQFFRFNTPDGYDLYDRENESDKWQYYEVLDSVSYIRKLDAGGTVQISVNSKTFTGNDNSIEVTGIAVDESGYVIVGTELEIFVLNNDGSLHFHLNQGFTNEIENIVKLPDGNIAALGNANYSYPVRIIDIDRKTWGEGFGLPDDASRVFIGGGGHYFLYSNWRMDLFGYDKTTGDYRKILNFIDTGVIFDVLTDVFILPEGHFLCVGMMRDSSTGKWLYRLAFLSKKHWF